VTDVLSQTVAIFGAERCLFGSNFPIEKLWTSYRSLVEAHLAAAAKFGADQRDAMFRTTAMRVYRLAP
jgi:predicted TIM-barrel fold metal-dependent hydrolase